MKKEMKKEAVLIILIFLLIPLASASVIINEIMPNPDDECSDCTEWVELYSDKEINLTGFVLDTTGQDIVLNTTINDFLIITGNKTKFLILWPINGSKVIEWKNIGLANSGDNVSLYNNTILISNTTYSSFSGSSNQNKIWARCNGNWSKYDMPTPGSQNNCTQQEEEQEDQEESEIKIIDAPGRAEFGETIEVEIDVYKGDTSKYAVYIYAEDENENKISNKVTLHFKTKFSSQTAIVELELKCKDETGRYEIVAEGLGTEDREEIDLDSCYEFSDSDDNATTIGDFSYSLTIPNTINLNENFTSKLKIASKAEQEQNFLVWSYVFRGSKCYSCLNDETRESNAKSITVLPGSSVSVEIEIKVEGAEPGIYKLKIKALQEGLKTPKEFTYDIQIKPGQTQEQTQESVKEQAQQTGQAQTNQDGSIEFTGITGAIIESKSFSINKTLPYILASLCALLAIYIIIKKI